MWPPGHRRGRAARSDRPKAARGVRRPRSSGERLVDDARADSRAPARALAARLISSHSPQAFLMRLDQFSGSGSLRLPRRVQDPEYPRGPRLDDKRSLWSPVQSPVPLAALGRGFFQARRASEGNFPVGLLPADVEQKHIVDAIAGEFGAARTRSVGSSSPGFPIICRMPGPDASPRTFLTAWREAAHHGAPPVGRAVDHLGLLEGVRKASEDRLTELGGGSTAGSGRSWSLSVARWSRWIKISSEVALAQTRHRADAPNPAGDHSARSCPRAARRSRRKPREGIGRRAPDDRRPRDSIQRQDQRAGHLSSRGGDQAQGGVKPPRRTGSADG